MRRSPCLLLAIAVAGCGVVAAHDTVPSALRFGGVRAHVKIQSLRGRRAVIVVTLTPEHGFHLYSVSFPAHGVDGVGQRTDIELSGALRRVGRLHVSEPVRYLRVSGVRGVLSVYPPGPIDVHVQAARAGGTEAAALLSYAACSATRCLPPVINHRVGLRL